MTKRLKQFYLIVDEKLADRSGVELLIDNFEADFSKLLVGAFENVGCEAGTDLL
jgi:hypothetical protein